MSNNRSPVRVPPDGGETEAHPLSGVFDDLGPAAPDSLEATIARCVRPRAKPSASVAAPPTPGDILAGLFSTHDAPRKLTPDEEAVRSVFCSDDLGLYEVPAPVAASTADKAPPQVVVNIDKVVVDARPPAETPAAAEVNVGSVKVATSARTATQAVGVVTAAGGVAASVAATIAFLSAKTKAGRDQAALVGTIGAAAVAGGALLSALGGGK
jgi:hypothetical protein